MDLGLLTNNFEDIITPQKTFSYALEFDGVNDVIIAGSFTNKEQNYLTSPFEAGDWTIEQWIKDFGNNSTSVTALLLFTSHLKTAIAQNQYFSCTHRKTDGYWEDFNVLMPANIIKTQWNHFVVRYTASLKRREMFLNNVLIGTFNSLKYPAETNSILSIGGSYNVTGLYRGKLDDLRVYTRALSNEEIAQSYNFGSGNLPANPTNLLYWFGFEMNAENWGSARCVPMMYNFINNPFVLR